MPRQPPDLPASDGTTEEREFRVARTFVELADTLVDEFDIAEFLHMLVERCVDLLDITAAGVVLADKHGDVRVAAASSEEARLLELFAAHTDDGPCIESVRSGTPVTSANLGADAERWPRFVDAARSCGFAAAHAVPMRLRSEVIGALSLLNLNPGELDAMSAELGQAMADVATIGILHQRSADEATVVVEKLQTTLNTRGVIEQAKGVLAAGSALTPEQSFYALRGYARARRRRLTELAHAVVDGTADVGAIVAHSRR